MEIPKSSIVILKIYDALVMEIEALFNEVKAAGTYEIEIDGSEYANCVYFYKLQVENYNKTKRMIYLK